MEILPPNGNQSEIKASIALNLDSRSREAAAFLHRKDGTGGLLSTVLFMDSIEDWVVARLMSSGDTEQEDKVRVRLRRLGEILTQYREKVAPDNNDLCQLLAWMKSSEALYTLDYLTQYQSDFTVQFITYCKSRSKDDVNANLAIERITVLYRTRLLDRVYSAENFDFVSKLIMEH